MPYKLFTGGQLLEMTTGNNEAKLFRSVTERFWLNVVSKDHCDTLVAEVHDAEADLYVVLDGHANLYLGGTLENKTTPTPGQHRGTGLQNADCHAINAGDLIVIPEGTPHMLDVRQSRLVYLVVKIDLSEAFKA
ncbi:MAG TPA: hypothetical protein VHV83_04435 [Armatimonadota bacterium]|nr:hypothetical protein [Armatimonadota bacterium]